MSSVKVAAELILAALGGVAGVRAYSDPDATISPPSTVLGPPSLSWEGTCSDPTSARWLVYVVVDVKERALEALWELVPLVAAALEGMTDVVVIRADPGTYLNGGVELPSYELQIEVSL